jgi:hypothetical protein
VRRDGTAQVAGHEDRAERPRSAARGRGWCWRGARARGYDHALGYPERMVVSTTTVGYHELHGAVHGAGRAPGSRSRCVRPRVSRSTR